MKYIVSAENSSYFYWQLELLIESFLYHGIQDDLIICMAENDKPKNISYCKNLAKYSKKIIHEDFAKDKGKKNLNRLLSLYNLVKKKYLSCPFVIIHSDMILKKPVELVEDIDLISSVINKKENVEEILIKNNENYKELDENLINYNFSMPVLFNYHANKETLDLFFLKLLNNYKDFYDNKDYENLPIEEAAWKQTIIDSFGHFRIALRLLSCNIHEELDANFIHYKNGIVPFFHKKYFKLEGITIHQDPFESLLKFKDSNENTKYIEQLIKSYRKRK